MGGRRPVPVEDLCTPVEREGALFLKREDLFEWAGGHGGKARLARTFAGGQQPKGFVTGGLRQSLQNVIVAQLAMMWKVPCRIHTASARGSPTVELTAAKRKYGARILSHRPGYLSVIRSRAAADARERGFCFIPPGMEHPQAFQAIAEQVANLPYEVTRIVVPVGGGATLIGVLSGLRLYHPTRHISVLGVCANTEPLRMLKKYFPPNTRGLFHPNHHLVLRSPRSKYSKPLNGVKIGRVELDPYYEAKCVEFLRPLDMLWVVGHRREVL